MVLGTKYDVIDLEKGRLDRRVLADESIYQEELEKIFGRAWLMLAHESLIPNPNDFFLSYMGEDPVIITRDARGGVHVFLNMCRHRGNRVVRADDGNAKNFMCTYHGWTFSNEGRLVSVPGLQEAYYGELDVERLGLVEARSDTYAGIIFATWAEDAPTLEAYLGDARYYLDLRFNRRDCGMQAIGPQKWIEPSNWKTAVDNTSDNYHGPVSHFSSSTVLFRRFALRRAQPGVARGLTGHQALFASPNKHVFVNGHCITVGVTEDDQPQFNRAVTPDVVPIIEAFHKATLPERERRLGSFRARRLRLGNHGLFPNTVLGLRMSLPRGPSRTEFWSFQTYEKDAPPEYAATMRQDHDQQNGISGMFEQDDQDNWIQMTGSGRVGAHREVRHQLSMGVGHVVKDPQFPGLVSERYISEHNQRHYYARWQEFMNAESWADIHVDPITADFEGTATMKG